MKRKNRIIFDSPRGEDGKEFSMRMMQFKVGEPKGIVYDVSGNEYERLDKIWGGVGGYFEVIHLLDNYIALIDEEGLLKGKEPNIILMGDCVVKTSSANALQIVGDILISKVGDNGEDFVDLTDDDIKFIQSRVSRISNYKLPLMMWSEETRKNDFWIED